jgi:hypothetical protein
MKWLMAQKIEHIEQRIAFEELLEGIRQESERLERLENAISRSPKLSRPCGRCGGFSLRLWGCLAEIGDLSRFQKPRELMGNLGLVPSENSTGDKVKRHHQGR